MQDATRVYLMVHELFGVIYESKGNRIELVTPVIPPPDMPHHPGKHEYKIARFKQGRWTTEARMEKGEAYNLRGVVPRCAVATNVPCHSQFSAHPPGFFRLKDDSYLKDRLYCRWFLPLPKRIHQLRLVSISSSYRPVFTGDPHGDWVEAQLNAISLAQAFEYEAEREKAVAIVDSHGRKLELDYTPDRESEPATINLHLWAQLEDESGMDDQAADKHAIISTDALVDLFENLNMKGTKSLSIDDSHATQVENPLGIHFPELMTLSERFRLSGRLMANPPECSPRTCGHGANLFIDRLIERQDR